jgi:glucokinase
MADVLREAAAAAQAQSGDLIGVGVGSPGQVDAAAGTVTSAKNLPGWDGSFQLADVLGDAVGAPVRVTNDVGAATDA